MLCPRSRLRGRVWFFRHHGRIVRGAILYHHTRLTHNFWHSAVLNRRRVGLAVVLCLLAPAAYFFLVFLF